MPARNTVKIDESESYYHIYARGNAKQNIFLESTDQDYFIHLLSRYLSIKQSENIYGRPYPHYRKEINLLAYCLMNNHFHLLIYQNEPGNMAKFMSSIMTSYSRYFNLKYKRTGALFETRYRAARIEDQRYLEHISRYIHLNPKEWQNYEYSSLRYYFETDLPEWLNPEKITEMFDNQKQYLKFLKDYEGHKTMLQGIKRELADSQ